MQLKVTPFTVIFLIESAFNIIFLRNLYIYHSQKVRTQKFREVFQNSKKMRNYPPDFAENL